MRTPNDVAGELTYFLTAIRSTAVDESLTHRAFINQRWESEQTHAGVDLELADGSKFVINVIRTEQG